MGGIYSHSLNSGISPTTYTRGPPAGPLKISPLWTLFFFFFLPFVSVKKDLSGDLVHRLEPKQPGANPFLGKLLKPPFPKTGFMTELQQGCQEH